MRRTRCRVPIAPEHCRGRYQAVVKTDFRIDAHTNGRCIQVTAARRGFVVGVVTGSAEDVSDGIIVAGARIQSQGNRAGTGFVSVILLFPVPAVSELGIQDMCAVETKRSHFRPHTPG